MFTIIQIFIIDVVCIDIGVSGDTDQRFFADPVIREYFGKVMKNQFFCQYVGSFSSGDTDESVKDACIAWNDADFVLVVFGFKDSKGIDGFIIQKWERLFFADDKGGQKRQHFMFKVKLQIFLFGFCCHLEINQSDLLSLQFIHQIIIDVICAAHHTRNLSEHRINLFFCGHVGFIFPDIFVQQLLIDQRADAHHKEFVKIGLVNGKKSQPFT